MTASAVGIIRPQKPTARTGTGHLLGETGMTATYYMTMDMVFFGVPPDNNTDHFDVFTDRFMDALCDLEDVNPDVTDPDITASLSSLTISVCMGVKADTQRDAERLFTFNVRTALDVAGYSPTGTTASASCATSVL
jgi:hypothetical protein